MAQGPATMMEGLSKVVSDLSQAMVAPDADIPFLTSVQGVVIGRMRQGMGAGPGAGGAGGAGGGGSPAPASPPGMQPGQGVPGGPPGAGGMPGGGMPPGAPMAGQPGPMGVQQLAQAPNPDELRRMLAGHVGA